MLKNCITCSGKDSDWLMKLLRRINLLREFGSRDLRASNIRIHEVSCAGLYYAFMKLRRRINLLREFGSRDFCASNIRIHEVSCAGLYYMLRKGKVRSS